MSVPEMADDERAEVERMLAELHRHGYTKRDSFNEMKPGVRVRHRGQQWPDAAVEGTGNIVAITERDPSSWSQSWGAPDIEMVVLFDKPWPFADSSRLSQLAQYHVVVIR